MDNDILLYAVLESIFHVERRVVGCKRYSDLDCS
jgi:hypothetical protein